MGREGGNKALSSTSFCLCRHICFQRLLEIQRLTWTLVKKGAISGIYLKVWFIFILAL